jgi:hypothetical protein
MEHVHRIHVRMGRPLSAPTHHGRDAGLGAFEDRLDPSVRGVADPSGHAERTGSFNAARAEEHPLHTAGDEHVDALHRNSVPQPGGTLPA